MDPMIEQNKADQEAAEDGADDIAEIEVADLFAGLLLGAYGGVGEQGKSGAEQGG